MSLPFLFPSASEQGMEKFRRAIENSLPPASTDNNRGRESRDGFFNLLLYTFAGLALANFATLIGSLIVDPDLDIFDKNEDGKYQNMKDTFGPITVGYLVGTGVLYALNIMACTSRRELSYNPYQSAFGKMWFNVMLTRNKLLFSIGGNNLHALSTSLTNSIANIVWYSGTTTAYGFLGAQMWKTVDVKHSNEELFNIYAIGSAIPMSIFAGLTWIPEIFVNGFPKILPDRGDYNMELCGDDPLPVAQVIQWDAERQQQEPFMAPYPATQSQQQRRGVTNTAGVF